MIAKTLIFANSKSKQKATIPALFASKTPRPPIKMTTGNLAPNHLF